MGNKEPTQAIRRLRHSKYFLQVMALVLVMMTLMPLPASAQTAAASGPRANQTLLNDAAANPTATFRVIVMPAGLAGGALGAILALGAPILNNVASIGFVAQVKGSDVAGLALLPSIGYITADAPVLSTAGTGCSAPLGSCNLAPVYEQSVQALQQWGATPAYTGSGVGVAIVDTGVNQDLSDFRNASGGTRIVAQAKFSANTTSTADGYGHGTHIAGIIGGNSWWNPNPALAGKYVGVAPQANLINVKVADDTGLSYTSDVINGIEWVIANRQAYNIRVLNLSLQSTTPESYHVSPLDAAVEHAWFSGIFVVAAAGNNGANSAYFAPANDPFVFTVGAADPVGTSAPSDDTTISWSSYGTTQDGYAKPDVLAPGRAITAPIPSISSVLAQHYPSRLVDGSYMTLSGSSMAAAVASGSAALFFQAHPGWNNDQAKYAFTHTALSLGTVAQSTFTPYPGQGAGEIDVSKAMRSSTPGYANQGLILSVPLLGPGGLTTYLNVPAILTSLLGTILPTSSSWTTSSWTTSSWTTSSWTTSSWTTSSWTTSSWTNAGSP